MAIPTHTLNDGTSLPAIGLGTYGLRDEPGISSLVEAIGAGYRLLDTGLNYENEAEVGEAVRRSGVDRDEFVVTTKIPGRHHGYEETLGSFEESRANLGLDRIDLYLIHWPLPRVDKYVDTWRAMIQLRDDGLVRSIGVSNFTAMQVTRLLAETGVAPAVNQIELHPAFPQEPMRAFDAEHEIVTEAWSPLGSRGELRAAPAVVDAADAHGVTPTRVILRWHVQRGIVPIPKSGNLARQIENLDVFDFALSDAEMTAISALESGRLWDADPDTHEEF
jgi:2,5-diketo-D-gluconate reductase A